MFWRYNIRHEATLSTAAEFPSKNLYRNVFAVVVEISVPTYLEAYEKYLTRLKIVDCSFNFKESSPHSTLKFHKFVLLNIYSDSLKYAPKVNKIGDIIRLFYARFSISVKGELVCYSDDYLDWMTFSSEGNRDRLPLSMNSSARTNERALTNSEKNRLQSLSEWSSNFFADHILKDVLWWNSFKIEESPKSKKGNTIQKNIDLVAKCVKLNVRTKKASFEDKYKNVFVSNFNENEKLTLNAIYKISGCEIHVEKAQNREFRMDKSDFTTFVLIPENSKDYINFGKLFENIKKAEFEEISAKIEEKSVSIEKKAISKDFVSAVDRRFSQTRLTSVSDLLKNLANPIEKVGCEFVLEGKVEGFSTTDFSQIIKKYIFETNQFYSIDSIFLKNLKSIIIYNFVMNVTSDECSSVLPVYICTTQGEYGLFDEWNIFPSVCDIEKWQSIKKKTFEKFDQKLDELKKSQARVKLAVKLFITKSGKPFYKLIETVFI